MTQNKKAIFYAILAALLYAISAPVSKILLNDIHPVMMAALLYLGAGIGLSILQFIQNRMNSSHSQEKSLTRNDLPFVVGMILLDILAPILLMIGLNMTTAANASLLNNFEIVATTIIALFFFKEKISTRLWFGILLISISSALLSLNSPDSLKFSLGSLFVILACTCWGLENNYTRVLSCKNPIHIVISKGFGSGGGALLIAAFLGDLSVSPTNILLALTLGFLAFGLSIYFYVSAQRHLGAARTSAYYAFAPFIGSGLSLIIFGEVPSTIFLVALTLMFIGAFFSYHDGNRTA